MTPQEYHEQQKAKLIACYNIEKSEPQTISKADNNTNDEFTNIVSDLFNIQALLEHCHRQTKDEIKHRALGDAYTALSDLKDIIIEQVIGATGKNYSNLKLQPIDDYNDGMNNKVAEDICNLSKQLKQFADKNNIMSVDNLSQDLEAIGNMLKYKLSLNGDKNFVQKAFDIINKSLSI